MWIVDRIEGNYALCETDEGRKEIPLQELPSEVSEGDVLRRTSDGWELDRDKTAQRRAQIAEKTKRLRKRKDSSGV